jgi:MFS family permease
VHIAGALAFLAVHGVAAAVALVLLSERRPERIRALLDLSAQTRPVMFGSFLVLLAGGVAAGFLGHWWGQGWIWTALALLVVLFVAAVPLAVPYYRRVRRAVAQDAGVEAVDLDRLLASPRPLVIAAVETAGILLILWLMVYKPF